MGSGSRPSEEGQTLAEYAVLVAGIAVACMFVLLVLAGGIGGWFDSSAKPLGRGAPFEPPTPAELKPQTEEDCTGDPGFAAYGYATVEDCLLDVPSGP